MHDLRMVQEGERGGRRAFHHRRLLPRIPSHFILSPSSPPTCLCGGMPSLRALCVGLSIVREGPEGAKPPRGSTRVALPDLHPEVRTCPRLLEQVRLMLDEAQRGEQRTLGRIQDGCSLPIVMSATPGRSRDVVLKGREVTELNGGSLPELY